VHGNLYEIRDPIENEPEISRIDSSAVSKNYDRARSKAGLRKIENSARFALNEILLVDLRIQNFNLKQTKSIISSAVNVFHISSTKQSFPKEFSPIETIFEHLICSSHSKLYDLHPQFLKAH